MFPDNLTGRAITTPPLLYFVPNNLRSSLGNWQAMTGASITIVGKTLARRQVV